MSGRDPAYPIPAYETLHGEVVYPAPGMTKREAFAMAAMQGFMANKANPMAFSPEQDAAYCIKVADALLAALDQEG